jgi:2-polyprenyl-3-methyl-5-hydroxy-6-metoxy-1,4-benzoquinol methylase
MSALDKHRIKITEEFIRPLLKPSMKIVDLGCGDGKLLENIASEEWQITAVDAATNALKLVEEKALPGVTTQIELLPCSRLPDKGYDLVLCCNMLAELEKEEHRLMVSELVRLVADGGTIVVTSALDTGTNRAAEILAGLLSTEMTIDAIECSYAGLQARWCPNAARFWPWLERLGSFIAQEHNRDFLLVQAHKKPLQ